MSVLRVTKKGGAEVISMSRLSGEATSRRAVLLALLGGTAGMAAGLAQTAAAGQVSGEHFVAISDNVVGAKDTIRIDLTRWSTDAERSELLRSWTDPGSVSGPGRGTKGPVDDATNDPFGTFRGAAAAAAAAAGAGRGGRLSAGPKPTPEASLTTAIGKAPTVGYMWSSEVAGYAIHSAVRVAEADGTERIILLTDRRLGARNDAWKPTTPAAAKAPASEYNFSIIELRLNGKGEGEGRISLIGKIAVDNAAKTLGPENYAALPVVLRNVKRRVR